MKKPKSQPREHELAIVYRNPEELQANKRNPRKHPPKQIQMLAASIRERGFQGAILVDDRDQVLSGNGLLAAAKKLGLTGADDEGRDAHRG